MTRRVAAATLKAWLSDGREIALIDLREPGHDNWPRPCHPRNASVTLGLDPRAQPANQIAISMDCRVKPGNDNWPRPCHPRA